MAKIKTLDGTSVKTPITTTSKPNFATDVEDVNITLPVSSGIKKLTIELSLLEGIHNKLYYGFDYLPNVDINQYLQYVVNLYNNGVETYPPKSI